MEYQHCSSTRTATWWVTSSAWEMNLAKNSTRAMSKTFWSSKLGGSALHLNSRVTNSSIFYRNNILVSSQLISSISYNSNLSSIQKESSS